MKPRRLAIQFCLAAWMSTAVGLPAVLAAQEEGSDRFPGVHEALEADNVRYYLSNELGMALEEISPYRREEAEYVLAVQSKEGEEVRSLLRDGRELKRWEFGSREERVYEQGELAERLLLDPRGRRLELREFEGGTLVRRTEFTYPRPGRITASTYDGAGNLLHTDHSRLSADSALREVRRETSRGPESHLGLSMSRDSLVEERAGGGGRELIKRYDSRGRLFEQERWIGGRLVERETLSYEGEGEMPASSAVTDYAAGITTLRSFDAGGHLLRLEVRRDGQVIDQTRYERDGAGRTVLAVRRGPGGMEQWSYAYNEEGELLREEYRLRGAVERVTRHEQGGRRVEELYRDGAVFLRVTYEGEEKVKEEFLRDGAVVRTRQYR